MRWIHREEVRGDPIQNVYTILTVIRHLYTLIVCHADVFRIKSGDDDHQRTSNVVTIYGPVDRSSIKFDSPSMRLLGV